MLACRHLPLCGRPHRLCAWAAAAAAGVVLWAAAPASADVVPLSVSQQAAAGQSFDTSATAHTTAATPLDVVFLLDTTTSMAAAIIAVHATLGGVLSQVQAAQPDAQFAVTEFKDIADLPPFMVLQNLTGNLGVLQTGLDALFLSGGGADAPEDWINGLFQVGSGAVAFRPGASHVVVLVGDASSHDPSGGHTLADAISAMSGVGARVVAVNAGQLDAAGQATAVVAATGGALLTAPSALTVTNTILQGLQRVGLTVSGQASCDPHLTVALTPASRDVIGGADAAFAEHVTVAAGTPAGTYGCTVAFVAAGDAGQAPVGTQTITVTVPAAPAPPVAAQAAVSPVRAAGAPRLAPLPAAFGKNGVFVLPSNRSCVSRRSFRIRIRRQRAGVTLVSAAVAVNGKRVAVRRGRRLTAPVDLRGLPKGRFTVRISALTADGRAISGTRRYRTCTPKRRRGGHGPLVLAASAAPSAAAAGAVPVLGVAFIESEGYGHAHPRKLSSGSQAITFMVTNIRWRNWGARESVGFGTGAYVPKGQPFSAARPEKEELVAYDLGSCRGRPTYRKLDWWFPGRTKRAHSVQRQDGSAASLCQR